MLAARLGSEGIVTQLRGAIDTPYPAGEVEVLVDASDLDAARELLLVDEVEAAFDEVQADAGRSSRAPWVVVVVLAALLVLADVLAVAYR